MTPPGENISNRREVLKGLGMGTLALPLMTETTTAQRANCTLSVSVEAGEGDWVPRDLITDRFSGRVDVSGLSSGGSHIAIMITPTGPDRKFNSDLTYATANTVDWSSGYIISRPPTWDPTGLPGGFGEWPDGTYHLYAVVTEAGTGNFGVAVSDPFEIDT